MAAEVVAAAVTAITDVEVMKASQIGMKAIAAALAVGLTGIAAAIAEMAIGSAAVGATAENKDVFGLVLLLTVIPETIVIFGLVVALLLIFKFPEKTMGLEAVVEEIREKGKKEAEKIRAASQQETDKILAAAGKRAGRYQACGRSRISKADNPHYRSGSVCGKPACRTGALKHAKGTPG